MSVKVSLAVFAALVVSTAAELNLIGLKLLSTVATNTTLIGLAGVKALLIALFFQDLKDEPKSLSSVLVLGLIIASLLMSITFLQLHPIHT